jgi:rhamnose utilization protein RhaD (predicted bifunctional aldolase and dehydrogenase)
VTDPIEQLLWLSHEIGRPHRDLVDLREGDVSTRLDGDRFLVRASNCPLATLTADEAIECHAAKILALLDMPLLDSRELDEALLEARVDKSAKRPSEEASYHAWLLQIEGVRFVASCAPPACLRVLCSSMAETFADQRMFAEQVRHCGAASVFVPYADPGSPLAREIRGRVTLTMRRGSVGIPKLIALQNRGIIALGPTAEAVLATLLMAEKSAEAFFGAAMLGGAQFLKPGQTQRLESPDAPVARPRLLKQ